MTIEGVDFSYGRPGAEALVAAGKRFVVRYVSGANGKALTKAEVKEYRAHGLAIALVFESTAKRALEGKTAGATDATTSAYAIDLFGFPKDLPVYFAVDFDASAGQQRQIDAYLTGAAQILGPHRVGVYAGIGPIRRCKRNGSAHWFWQTLAWSGGEVAKFIHLYQYQTGSTGAKRINGAAVDNNRAMQAAFGQWDPPTPPDTSSGDAMELSDQVKLGQNWIDTWPDDNGIADGSISVNTALGSGYAASRQGNERIGAMQTQLDRTEAKIDRLLKAIKAAGGAV